MYCILKFKLIFFSIYFFLYKMFYFHDISLKYKIFIFIILILPEWSVFLHLHASFTYFYKKKIVFSSSFQLLRHLFLGWFLKNITFYREDWSSVPKFSNDSIKLRCKDIKTIFFIGKVFFLSIVFTWGVYQSACSLIQIWIAGKFYRKIHV